MLLDETRDLSKDELQSIQEAYGLAPFKLKVVDKMHGISMYSSDSVKKKFINAIDNTRILKPIKDEIEFLVEKGQILPVFASKNLVQYISHKLFSHPGEKSIMGMFSSEKNKVYIILDNNVSGIFFHLSNKDSASLIFHELQHYAAWNLRERYLGALNVELNQGELSRIISFMFTNSEMKKNIPNNFLKEYAELLHSIISKKINDEAKSQQMVTKLLMVVHLYLSDSNRFFDSLRRKDKNVMDVYTALWNSYRAIGVKNPRSTVIQELLYPSEISAIQCQYSPTSENYKLIKLLG